MREMRSVTQTISMYYPILMLKRPLKDCVNQTLGTISPNQNILLSELGFYSLYNIIFSPGMGIEVSLLIWICASLIVTCVVGK